MKKITDTASTKNAAKHLEKRISEGKRDETHRRRAAQKAAFIGQKTGKNSGSLLGETSKLEERGQCTNA